MVRVTLSINYCWLQPFKYSFLDLVLFDIYKQGLKILFNKVNFKYTFFYLILTQQCNIFGAYNAREAQVFQAWGLVDLWWLAHKIASTLKTTPLSQIEPIECLDVQMKDQFHCNSSTNSWQLFLCFHSILLEIQVVIFKLSSEDGVRFGKTKL